MTDVPADPPGEPAAPADVTPAPPADQSAPAGDQGAPVAAPSHHERLVAAVEKFVGIIEDAFKAMKAGDL